MFSIFFTVFLFSILTYSVKYDLLCEFDGTSTINLSFQGLSKNSSFILVVDNEIPSGYDNSVVMIIQVQGGIINSTNTTDYGGNDGTGRGYISIESGFYEFNIIESYISTGGQTTITLENIMLYDYSFNENYNFQILLVPYCETVILSNTITTDAWDGSKGGIIAFLATNLVIEDSTTIDVSGLGFRGGPDMDEFSASVCGIFAINFADDTANLPGNPVKNAHKGEGICGSPLGLGNPSISTYPNGWDSARGAPCNAGGGSNCRDSGGGGGANGGNGGAGRRQDPYYAMFNPGLGGVECPYDINNIFFGGGGGSGHRNANGPPGPFLRGMNGAGIIYIHVDEMLTLGNNISILANGIDGDITEFGDGGGGGGAGGTVVLLHNQDSGTSWHGMTIDLSGGNGTTTSGIHGGGGGGGGGVFISSSQVPFTNFNNNGGFAGDSGDLSTGDDGNGGSITDNRSGLDFPSQVIFNLQISESTTPTPTISTTSTATNSSTPTTPISITPTPTISTTSTATISTTSTATISTTSTTPISITPTTTISTTSTATISTISTTPISSTSTTTISTTPTPTSLNSITPTPTNSDSRTRTSTISLSHTSNISKSSSSTTSNSQSLSNSISHSKSISLSRTISPSIRQFTSITSFNTILPTQFKSVTISHSPIQEEYIVGPSQPIPTETVYEKHSPENYIEIISKSPAPNKVPLYFGTQIHEESISITTYDSDITLIVNQVDSIIFPPPSLGILQSSIFNITEINEYGEEVQPLSNVEICISVENTNIKDDSCLSFFNEEINDWECVDDCLQVDKDNRLCGNTNHFTSFAILLEGKGRKANICDSSINNYIFNEGWKDGILIISVLCFLCFICIIFLSFISFTNRGRKFFYGNEGSRIQTLRKAWKNY